MKIHTPCTDCKDVHTTLTTAREGEVFTTEPHRCFACSEKKEREERAQQFVKGKKR